MPTEPDVSGATATLRLSALCALPVVDELGGRHGTVLDVRIVRGGPTNASGDLPLRIDGLVVGRSGWAERLGLFRSAVHGPWLLEQLSRWATPRRAFLPWAQVVDPNALATATEVCFRGELQPIPDDRY